MVLFSIMPQHIHYWKRVLCRGPNLGHSAKTLFAEGQPQEPSAKNGGGMALGKDRPTANQIFAMPSAN